MENCFGLFNMRKGVMTIGIIGAVLTAFALVGQFVVMANQRNIMPDEKNMSGNNLFSFIIIIGIVVCFFKILADCLLVYGAVKQTTREVSLWLAINLCVIIYVFIIMVFIYWLFSQTHVPNNYRHGLIGLLLILNVFCVYIWRQVYLFSRQLDLDGRTSLEGIINNLS